MHLDAKLYSTYSLCGIKQNSWRAPLWNDEGIAVGVDTYHLTTNGLVLSMMLAVSPELLGHSYRFSCL